MPVCGLQLAHRNPDPSARTHTHARNLAAARRASRGGTDDATRARGRPRPADPRRTATDTSADGRTTTARRRYCMRVARRTSVHCIACCHGLLRRTRGRTDGRTRTDDDRRYACRAILQCRDHFGGARTAISVWRLAWHAKQACKGPVSKVCKKQK